MRTFRKILSHTTAALAVTFITGSFWMSIITLLDMVTGAFKLIGTYGHTAVIAALIASLITGVSLLLVSESSYVRE